MIELELPSISELRKDPTQMRIMCAVVAGWTIVDGVIGLRPDRPSDHHHYQLPIPKYDTSRDAMSEARKLLTPDERRAFLCHLASQLGYTFEVYSLHATAVYAVMDSEPLDQLIAFLLAKGLVQ
jgi:hypothetical protein